jgi:hypothetical protein
MGKVLLKIKILVHCISDKQAKVDNVNFTLISYMAKKIFSNFKDDDTCQVEFSASKGWFYNFKLRTGIHLAVRHAQLASSDIQAAENYISKFAQ